MDHFLEIFLHAVKETLPLLPWLIFIYALIELLESKANLQNSRLGGKYGPVIGSATGLIPQCGFSVMASKLFEQRYITVGTLLAIFFSTSDEAFIILLSSMDGAVWVLPMLAIKVAVGIAVGYGVDGLLKCFGRGQVCAQMPESSENAPTSAKEIFIQRYLDEKDVEVVCSCGKSHGTSAGWKKYVLYPLMHALKVALFIFLVNFILGAIVHSVGNDAFSAFMSRSKFVQPFITCAIGLIPNCASSVVLTETFLSGGITFGSCVAGLCANAGMGYVVLLKNTKKWKRNLALIAVSYFLSVAVGLACNLLPV